MRKVDKEELVEFYLEVNRRISIIEASFKRLEETANKALANQNKKIDELAEYYRNWTKEADRRELSNVDFNRSWRKDSLALSKQHHKILEGYLKTFIKIAKKK